MSSTAQAMEAQLLRLLASQQRDHSIFSASGSATWLGCPGSLIPNALLPDNAGIEAAQGTVLHEVTEEWLQAGQAPEHMVGENRFVPSGEWGFLIEITEASIEIVRESIDFADQLVPYGRRYIEERVDFSHLTPISNQGGTLDLGNVYKDHLDIIDWKYGAGVLVESTDNSQEMLYAIGMLRRISATHKIRTVTLHIGQPLLNNWDSWDVSLEELEEFEQYVKERASLAWDFHAKRTPSPKACRWCKVADCAARAKENLDLTAAVFGPAEYDEGDMRDLSDFIDTTSVLTPIEIGSLTTAQLAILYQYKRHAVAWWEGVKKELLRRKQQGETVPYWKLVEGRRSRNFRSASHAEEGLRKLGLGEEDIWDRKMRSPAQIEGILTGKMRVKRKQLPELLDQLVWSAPGKPTLAPHTDKRPEIDNVDDNVFEQALADEVYFDDLD